MVKRQDVFVVLPADRAAPVPRHAAERSLLSSRRSDITAGFMSVITVYHNPKCSNARGALELIRERGFEPQIVEYLKTPLSAEALRALVAACGVPVRELMRSKEAVFSELGLDDPAVDDDTLIAAIAAHPVLLNRPIVSTPLGTRLCRPPERVLDILPAR